MPSLFSEEIAELLTAPKRGLLTSLIDEATRSARPKSHVDRAPDEWEPWLRALFPRYVRHNFAPRHRLFWEWVWSIEEEMPRPFVGIWSRGGAKSSSVELAVAALGLRGVRKYVLYIRGTQDRADDSVQNIATMLESSAVERFYPPHGQRLLSKFGDSRGWRRNRIRTEGGLTIDALGLDVAARGVKLDENRPDVFCLDDVDERHDTKEATEKKLTTLKESIGPAGSPNVAVIAIQNLIIPRGVFGRLVDGSADFLSQRILSGPEPAVLGLKTEPAVDAETGEGYQRITAGTPTWEGQDLAACQALIRLIGFSSFNRECQHQVADREGALWTREILNRTRIAPSQLPPLKRIVVGVDPSGGAAEIGIVAMGESYNGHGYVLSDRTQKGSKGPNNWGRTAVTTYQDLKADRIVAESNFGGDMVKSTILISDSSVPVRLVPASRGKAIRAEPIAAMFEEGKIHMVGTFPELEAELTGWVPGDPESPNRLDAMVWAGFELFVRHTGTDEAPRTHVFSTLQ